MKVRLRIMRDRLKPGRAAQMIALVVLALVALA